MADNLTLNAGCGGATLATDEIGCPAIHYQWIKVAFGADNTATKVTACAGLPVCVKNTVLSVDDNCGSLTVDNAGLTELAAAIVTCQVQVDIAAISCVTFPVTDNCGALTVDHTNLCNLHSADFDTGAGTDTTPAIGIALPGCGGAVVGGTCTNPVRTDPTGTTTQPVSDACGSLTVDGTVTVQDGCGSLTVDNSNLCTIAGAVSGTEMQVDVVAALPAGTNTIGKVGLDPQTSGGWCVFRSIDLDESEEQVKASAGQLGIITAFNTSCALRFLKVYNAPAACVTVGGACATTPVMTFPIPAHTCSKGAGLIFSCPVGWCLGGTGITVAATTGVADCDTGAPGANQVVVNLGYK